MMFCKMKVFFSILMVLESFIPSNAAPQQRPALNLSPQTYAPTVSIQTRFNFIDLELLKHTADATSGNFMISPASIKSSLGMILEGAKGSCADELRRNLRLPSDEKLARDQLTGFLSDLQVPTPGITLHSVNKIFLSHRLTPRQEFVNILNSVYYSQVDRVDFSQPQKTANEVNKWVNSSTRGLIPTLVEPNNFEPDTVMLIANALYFKGIWENAFDVKMTVSKCFETPHGCQYTPMMDTQAEFNYGQITELAAQAIELPYQGGRYSMLILLPVDKQGLNFLIKDLPAVPLPQILSQMDKTDVQISMPRFSVDFSVDLVSILRNVGIREVFTSTANLSGIVEGNIANPQVNNFFHKTRIEVNEKGSVAAAATGAMVVPLMSSTTDRMVVDHPFFFFIRDMKTGAVLFEGRVEEPDLASPDSYQTPSYLNADDLAIFTSTENSRVARPYAAPARQPSAYNENRDGIQFEPVENEPAQTIPALSYSPQPQPPVRNADRFSANENYPSSVDSQVRYPSPQSPTNYNPQNTHPTASGQTHRQWSQTNGKRLIPSNRMPVARSISISSSRQTFISNAPQNSQPSYNPPALRFAVSKTHAIPVKGGVISTKNPIKNHRLGENAINILPSDFQTGIPNGGNSNTHLPQTETKRVETNFQRPLPVDNDGIRFTL